jgi:hypothetical protein
VPSRRHHLSYALVRQPLSAAYRRASKTARELL